MCSSDLFDLPGRMYIAAWHNSRIRRMDLGTGALEDVCGTGGRAYAGDGGPALAAVLDLPAGLAFDPDGNLLVVDQANQVIRRIAGDGMIHRVAGVCVVDECAPGATPTACPGTDKFSCTMGEDPSVCMNPCQPAFGGDGGPALEARFSMPFGQSADPAGRIAVALDGTMYLADTRNHRIRRIGTDGIVTTYAGTGARGASGDGGGITRLFGDLADRRRHFLGGGGDRGDVFTDFRGGLGDAVGLRGRCFGVDREAFASGG